MIVIPTASWLHAPFDLLAWASGALLGRALYRWRLERAALDLARATCPGYCCCLAVGAGVLAAEAIGGPSIILSCVATIVTKRRADAFCC